MFFQFSRNIVWAEIEHVGKLLSMVGATEVIIVLRNHHFTIISVSLGRVRKHDAYIRILLDKALKTLVLRAVQ